MARDVLIVGGPNGAGKTTWVREALGYQGSLYLSADQIAAELSPASPEAAAIRAGRTFLCRLRAAIELGEELIVESTLSGRGMARFMALAHDHGYRVVIVFVFLHRADLCVRRVRARVRKGGHGVPEDDILRRFARSAANLWRLYRPLTDEWHLYFNGGESFEMVASGNGGRTMVHSRARFDLFPSDEEAEPMRQDSALASEIGRHALEFSRIGNEAVRKAREENRRLGIPNVFAVDGRLCWELPNGEITFDDPDAESITT